MAEDAWNSCDPERVSIGEDRVLHLNTLFTWAYLDLGVYAHTRIKGCPCPTRRDLRRAVQLPRRASRVGTGAVLLCAACGAPRSPHDLVPDLASSMLGADKDQYLS
jgi:hypothetical protein